MQALENAGATVIDLDAANFNFAPADGEFLVLLFDFRISSTWPMRWRRDQMTRSPSSGG